MAIFSTGPIENNPVSGVRPTQTLTVLIDCAGNEIMTNVLVQGYYLLGGTRNLYVSEDVSIGSGQVVTNNYFANLDALDFVFTVNDAVTDQLRISVWGKSGTGELVTAHRIVTYEKYQ